MAVLGLFALALTGCSRSSTLEVRARASLADSTGLAGLVLTVGGREIRASSFRPDGSGIPEVRLEVPGEGRLRIDVQLAQAGVVVADGAVGWDLADDYEWGLDIFRQATDPTDDCIGCAGSERIPISAAAQGQPDEALWFAWGGKPRGSDIVF